ncbi:MAG: hypothetical protein HYX87_07015 [Chloroflexi bacterium]|nr:hypothetical protein [Chloroflexota bacterium]
MSRAALRLDPDESWGMKVDEWALSKGTWRPEKQLVFRRGMGSKPADFLWTRLPPLLCVSTRVVALLSENAFSGWATYPVEVHDRADAVLPNYLGFSITGPQIDRDLSRSQIIYRPAYRGDSKTWPYYRGIYFDESKWDRSDFFWVQGWQVVTHRVQEALVRAKVTNVRFKPLSDIEVGVEVFRSGKKA